MARSYTRNYVEPKKSKVARGLCMAIFALQILLEQEQTFLQSLTDEGEIYASQQLILDLKFAVKTIKTLKLNGELSWTTETNISRF